MALKLDGCPIGDDGAAALLQVLQFDENVTLQKLSLSHTQLRCVRPIRACLLENKSLTHLYLHNTTTTSTQQQPFAFQNVFDSLDDVTLMLSNTGRALQVLALPPMTLSNKNNKKNTLTQAIAQNKYLRQLHLCHVNEEQSVEMAWNMAEQLQQTNNRRPCCHVAGLDTHHLQTYYPELFAAIRDPFLLWKNTTNSCNPPSRSSSPSVNNNDNTHENIGNSHHGDVSMTQWQQHSQTSLPQATLSHVSPPPFQFACTPPLRTRSCRQSPRQQQAPPLIRSSSCNQMEGVAVGIPVQHATRNERSRQHSPVQRLPPVRRPQRSRKHSPASQRNQQTIMLSTLQ